MARRDKHNYYLDIAETVLERGTCLRRNYGSIIVKDDEIIATGYTGAPRGRKNCCDIGTCKREELNIPRGTQYEKCRSVHAELNCCLSCSRRDMIGSTLYLAGKDMKTGELVKDADSCSMCKRAIINSGIEKVIIRDTQDEYRVINVRKWVIEDESLTDQVGY